MCRDVIGHIIKDDSELGDRSSQCTVLVSEVLGWIELDWNRDWDQAGLGCVALCFLGPVSDVAGS